MLHAVIAGEFNVEVASWKIVGIEDTRHHLICNYFEYSSSK